MDKVYQGDIPRHKKVLEELKQEFARVDPATDWATLRIQPLLDHVTALERLLRSPKFSKELARLRKGVVMFHADLVYLRTNIKTLKEILAAEQRRHAGGAKATRRRRRARGVAAARAAGGDMTGSDAAVADRDSERNDGQRRGITELAEARRREVPR